MQKRWKTAFCTISGHMPSAHFSTPPTSLPLEEQHQWLLRHQEAERIAGITAAGIPLVSQETLALLGRYVQGELTLAQVQILQGHRLGLQ